MGGRAVRVAGKQDDCSHCGVSFVQFICSLIDSLVCSFNIHGAWLLRPAQSRDLGREIRRGPCDQAAPRTFEQNETSEHSIHSHEESAVSAHLLQVTGSSLLLMPALPRTERFCLSESSFFLLRSFLCSFLHSFLPSFLLPSSSLLPSLLLSFLPPSLPLPSFPSSFPVLLSVYFAITNSAPRNILAWSPGARGQEILSKMLTRNGSFCSAPHLRDDAKSLAREIAPSYTICCFIHF